jgi:hypothetical protein
MNEPMEIHRLFVNNLICRLIPKITFFFCQAKNEHSLRKGKVFKFKEDFE